MMARALIHVPKTATQGSVIAIKTLISHPMETGYRHGDTGARIPRNIINRFTCTYNGEEVFRADLHPAVAANPYITFHTVATETGVLAFTWVADDDETHTELANITVD
jgi:sulfur-oxidizing protein SoxZ